MNKLFLSHSVNRDLAARDCVRQLFDRFQQQLTLDPWVYESPRDEVHVGGSIAEACRRVIEAADIFLVFINDDALQSEYVKLELTHALMERRRRPLAIVPLIATRRPRREWPSTMIEAADFKGFNLSGRDDDLEPIVIYVCDRLQTPYLPPHPSSPRFPLRQRLSRELQARRSSGYDAGDFIAILRKCDLASEAMDRDDYHRARQLVEAVLTDLELLYGFTEAYYPRIALGAILMGEAHAGRRSFGDAEKHFAALIAEQAAALDANAFAGRGNALMALGRFKDALDAYSQAEPCLDSPDAALFYNMIRARVLGSLPVDRDELRRWHASLRDGLATRAPGDLARVGASLVLAYAYLGDTAAASQIWGDSEDMQAVFPELIVDIAHTLHRQAIARVDSRALDLAERVLREYLLARNDLEALTLLPVRHVAARVAFAQGKHRAARQQLSTLIASFPFTPFIHVDAAMFALADGDRRSASRWCSAVISLTDHSRCQPPLTSREFNYALGQAFWLLGRRPEAVESFRRSEYHDSLSYASTLPAAFGLVA